MSSRRIFIVANSAYAAKTWAMGLGYRAMDVQYVCEPYQIQGLNGIKLYVHGTAQRLKHYKDIIDLATSRRIEISSTLERAEPMRCDTDQLHVVEFRRGTRVIDVINALKELPPDAVMRSINGFSNVSPAKMRFQKGAQ